MPSTAADVHLSDVHLHCPGSTSAADEISRFAFSTDSAETSAAAADGDGDQVLKRRRAGRSGALKLRHALATPLPDVGLQVWRGALLLCDYLLARPALVSGATILELGAGCGLCGLLAAGTARRVFVTDNVEGVLANAQANVELNGVEAVARVRTLDWAEPVLPSDATEEEAQPSAHCHPAGDDAGGAPSAGARPAAVDPFAWSAEERAELRDCNLVLAADCVYGDDMTDALVACLHALLHALPRGAVALVAMEKRINFCLASLAACAPAVDHFAQGLEVAGLEWRRVPPSSFAQGFVGYERVKELELWRVTAPGQDGAGIYVTPREG